MDLGITGRNALITGGSQGIGAATAKALHENGCNLVLVARDKERLDAFAQSLSTPAGPKVHAISTDISIAENVPAAAQQAQSALGHIDILINNAGSTPAGGLTNLPDEAWRDSFELKLMGYVRFARALMPAMCERQWGRIVNIAGLGAYQANPRYVAGGAINAACLAITKSLAKEAAPNRVTVNAINPGPVDTARWRDLLVQRAKQSGRTISEEEAISFASVPMGRAALPEEVAALIAFLCCGQAGYISGSLINIDGAASFGL